MSNQDTNKARWVVGIAVRVLALAMITSSLISFGLGWSDYSAARAMMKAGMAPNHSIFLHFRAEWTTLFLGIALPLLTKLFINRIVPLPKRTCAGCGYDLKQLKICPECGAEA